MNNEAETEGRPRPLSAGLWTLFSWLRRDDRSVSTDSLSSAGSDRTVASFAFLTPALYPSTGPIVLPPQGPPTDSYRKRLYDRNIRRHHDRDLTLHSKYGLHKSEGVTSYDAFSLPPVRRTNGESSSKWDRERRATSECYQRRLAHVPGKRRAPLPPGSGATNSLTRRSSRKRPAPQPPVKLFEKNKENTIGIEINTPNTQMTSNPCHDKPKLSNNEITMGCKSEKYSKKETGTKDTKIKSEKSFLKQIFDSKKRNSGIDTSSIKVLPSISELDKQAAEIIETCKLKATEQNNNIRLESKQSESWICTSCLRKYKSSIVTCEYCVLKQKNQTHRISMGSNMVPKASSSYTQTEKDVHNVTSTKANNSEERQKLKEMLKEMKDSLPKRAKHDFNITIGDKTAVSVENFGRTSYSTETPTLRVGATTFEEKKKISDAQPSTSKNQLKSSSEPVQTGDKPYAPSEQSILVAQVISAYKKNFNDNLKLLKENKQTAEAEHSQIAVDVQIVTPKIEQQPQSTDTTALHTPLKISSLLNPMYVPKKLVLNESQLELTKNLSPDTVETSADKSNITSVNKCVPVSSISAGTSSSRISEKSVNIARTENNPKANIGITKDLVSSQKVQPAILKESKRVIESKPKETECKLTSASKEQNVSKDVDSQNQHFRRRALINQLEKSIAKGDERAAAEAAIKLAQLRLSCSVLSFSSQILSQPSTSCAKNVKNDETEKEQNSSKNESQQNVVRETTQCTVPTKVTTTSESVNNGATSAGVTPLNVTQSSEPKVQLVEPIPVQRKTDAAGQQVIKKTSEVSSKSNDNGTISIAVLVEDREATRGPVHLRISRQAIMRDLRREAETTLGVATNLQRWIVGRALCVDDSAPVASLAGPRFTAPFYLCVVESDTKDTLSVTNKASSSKTTNEDSTQKAGLVYTELMQLEQQALVPNTESFECGVCMEEYPPGQGAVLRECVHIFCKECLSDVVRHCEEPDIACPAMGCRGMLQEREIRALVSPQDYERWLARGLAAAESGTRNAFHCRTRDCQGWALCEPGVQRFPCPVCKRNNCVPCQAIHDGETCEQYKAKIKQAAVKSVLTNDTDDGTRTLLNSLISKGEALECPECSAIITKKWGCDWVKCSACKTEICWVTRGRRWGPAGKGDTSAGCRCGVDGKRCHPSCGYCH